MIKYILILVMLFMAGCSPDVNTFDGVIRGEDGNPVDNQDGSLAVVQDFESKTHDGTAFISGTSITLTNGQTKYLYAKTDGKEIHFKFRSVYVTASAANQVSDISVDLYESGTVTTNGTSIATFNLNRKNTTASTLLIYKDPTGVNLASATFLEPFGNRIITDKKTESEGSQGIEYIMKSNTRYILKVTNNGVSTTDVRIKWLWHEE